MDKSTGKREWVYPMHIKGRFQNYRRWSFLALQLFLLLTPWWHINGQQVVRIDLPARQVLVAGSIYGARDTIFIVLGLLFAAFLLFLVTALWGRVWCGYACPQTVFLETFVHNIERWFEGNRGKRMQLDKQPWTAKKAALKIGKHAVFMAAAALVSMVFMSWFAGTVPLWTGQASWSAYGFVGIFTAGMYLDFAWFREQFCNFLCPYARFQGAIAGANSLTVSYDVVRGEPRRVKGVKLPKTEQGGCISCNKCVAVCPQGIDIRNGFQLECIGCAKCIDACTPVMARFNEPSLVRYSTVAQDEGGARPRLVRPRTVLYAALMLVCTGVFAGLMANRHALDVNVNRVPGSLFTIDDDGATRNTFLLQLMNKQWVAEPAELQITVEGIDGAEVIVPPVTLATGETRKVPLVVRAPAGTELKRTEPITIHVQSAFDDVRVPATFKSGTEVNGS